MLQKHIETAFKDAINNKENFVNGKLNMNYVEADVYMSAKETFGEKFSVDEILNIFDKCAENFLQNMVDGKVEYC